MIIAISGKLRSGKSTAANYLSEKLNIPIISLAHPLYKLCAKLDGTDQFNDDGWTKGYLNERARFEIAYAFLREYSNKGIYLPDQAGIANQIARTAMNTPTGLHKNRPRLVVIAEYMRSIDPDFWVKVLDLNLTGKSGAIVSDIRQRNELEYLRDRGAYLLRINIDSDIQRERIKAKNEIYSLNDVNHSKELELDDYAAFDYYVQNDSSLSDFLVKLDRVLSRIQSAHSLTSLA